MEMPVFVVGCYCSCEIGGDWRGLHKRLNVRGTRSFSSFLVVVVVVVSGMGGGRQRREVVVFLVVVGVGAGEDRDQQQRGGGWAGLDLVVRSGLCLRWFFVLDCYAMNTTEEWSSQVYS
jgi:hypothetical protein